MDQEVFEKILYDLRAINYSKLIGPFVNNEPLMDKRIDSFIRMISHILPSASSYLFSNGDLLDKERLHGLFDAGLQKVIISVHSGERVSFYREMLEYFGGKRVAIYDVLNLNKEKSFHNRGGSITSEIVNQDKSEGSCVLPFRQVIVNPDGDICLCCCDFYYEAVFGNVKNSSLVDIFMNNEKLNEIREHLCKKSRKGLVLCENCSVPPYAPLLTL